MRTWCYLVAAMLAAHAGAAFAGGYLRVIGPSPLRFQPQPAPPPSSATAAPAPAVGDATTTAQQALGGDDRGQPCSTNAPMRVIAPETSSSETVAVESGLAAPTSTQDQPADQQPLTSQVLAEIFRHTAGTSTNQSTTVVVPSGFMPPQPAPRSSTATYTDH